MTETRPKKKVVYLDQNAISNLAHVRYETGRTPASPWVEINERLNRVVHKQLVVCPVSFTHQIESACHPLFESFMGTVGYFAGGCSFHDFHSIRSEQLMACFRASGKREPPGPWRVQIGKVMSGDPDGLWAPIPQSLYWQMSEEQINSYRGDRQQAYNRMTNVFQHWKAHPERRLEDWKRNETRWDGRDYGEVLLRSVLEAAAAEGDSDLSAAGHSVVEFVRSSIFEETPFLKISSWLYATAARKALHQKEPPSRGFLGDVEFISCLLPYCDAMLLDNECRAYLNELQCSGRLTFDTQIFSPSNGTELLAYLDLLDRAAPTEVCGST